ncbi:MAG: MASE1 domain-containing protein [Parachlamydiaceae bacterium]|nr:MASE1 domain-containing protein [Parachlamydiaceae bacterium]
MAIYPVNNHDRSHTIFILCIVFILYFAFGKLGLLVAIPGTNVTPIWPPSGLALGVVLLFGIRVLPAIFLGSSILNSTMLVGIVPDASWWTILSVSTITGIGATLQAAFGLFLIHYFANVHALFDSVTSVVKFLFAAVLSCLINSNIGVLALCFSNIISWNDYPSVWWTWFIGDIGGAFVVTPLILTWAHLPPLQEFTTRKCELLALLASIGAVIFLTTIQDAQFKYLLLPCLVWATMRFNLPIAIGINALIATILVLAHINGYGLFQITPISTDLFNLTCFITVLTGTVLMLSAESANKNAPQYLWTRKPRSLIQFFKHWWHR